MYADIFLGVNFFTSFKNLLGLNAGGYFTHHSVISISISVNFDSVDTTFILSEPKLEFIPLINLFLIFFLNFGLPTAFFIKKANFFKWLLIFLKISKNLQHLFLLLCVAYHTHNLWSWSIMEKIIRHPRALNVSDQHLPVIVCLRS